MRFNEDEEQQIIQRQGRGSICEGCHRLIPYQSYEHHTSKCRSIERNKSKINISYLSEQPGKEMTLGSITQIKRANQKKIKEELKNKQERINCTFCGYMMTLQQLDTHHISCTVQQKACQFCGQQFPGDLMDEHYSVCQAKKSLQTNLAQSEQQPSQLFGNLNQAIDHLTQLIYRLHQASQGQNNSQGLSQKQRNLLKIQYYKKSRPEGDLCTVCYCQVEEKQQIIVLECKHLYHPECIRKWLEQKSSCPNCKRNLKQQEQ